MSALSVIVGLAIAHDRERGHFHPRLRRWGRSRRDATTTLPTGWSRPGERQLRLASAGRGREALVELGTDLRLARGRAGRQLGQAPGPVRPQEHHRLRVVVAVLEGDDAALPG